MSALPTDDRGWFQLVLGNQPLLWRLYTEACGGEVLTDTDVGGLAIMVRDPDGQLLELMPMSYRDT